MNGQPGKLAIRIPAFLVEPDVMLLVNDPNRWATEKWQYESAMQGFRRPFARDFGDGHDFPLPDIIVGFDLFFSVKVDVGGCPAYWPCQSSLSLPAMHGTDIAVAPAGTPLDIDGICNRMARMTARLSRIAAAWQATAIPGENDKRDWNRRMGALLVEQATDELAGWLERDELTRYQKGLCVSLICHYSEAVS